MSFGAVTFDEPVAKSIQVDRSGKSLDVKISKGRWNPPNELRALVDHGVYLPLERRESPDGFRRYLPDMGLEALLNFGPKIGEEILRTSRRLTPDEVSYYQGMQEVFRLARGAGFHRKRGMHAHLTRKFQSARDLHLRKGSRAVDSERSIIPSNVGSCPEAAVEESWGGGKLINEAASPRVTTGWRPLRRTYALPMVSIERRSATRSP